MVDEERDYTSITADIIDDYLPRKNKFPQVMDSAARRNLRIPEVTKKQFEAYEKQHLSKGAKEREHIDAAHQRSLDKLAQKRLPSIEGRTSPDDAKQLLKPAIRRLGSPAAEPSATQGKKHVRFALADEPLAQERPLRVTNRDGTANQFNGYSRTELPQAVVNSAFRRQGFDASSLADAEKLAAKHTEARKPFTQAEKSAQERPEGPMAETGYDERPRARSLSI